MSDAQHPSILVAPLNWGLGHATRCVPLIHALERLGARVILASDGSALALLKAEFPHLTAVELPSYHIRYQTRHMVWNIARQLPRITYAIRAEQWATDRLVRKYRISGIISDNRYGCFSPQAHNVILTHQIHLLVPNAALQWTANQVLRLALRKFDELWIPDSATEPNLSEALSHPPLKDIVSKYIGVLSRFEPNPQPDMALDAKPKVAVVLSGPEPQRTYLEQILMEQALALPHKFVFVKGKPQLREHHLVGENLEVISYLTSTELNQLLQSSQLMVCRAGYSSIMDLAVLAGTKAILIPTPGQTEQEYLGGQLAEKGYFVCQQQESVDLASGLRAAMQTKGFAPDQFEHKKFEAILETWLKQLPEALK